MPRVVSLIVLLAIVVLTGALFFQVIAQFVLPMFLAVLLVVLFRPLHQWFIDRCGKWNRLAALLTTLTILLIVLLPLTWIGVRATTEAVTLARAFDETKQVEVKHRVARIAEQADGLIRSLKLHDIVDVSQLQPMVIDKLKRLAAPAAVGGVQYVLGLVVGLAIMVISLYYFLADGPSMIATIMRLSPLEERYERQLLGEFAKVSRAVVLATLLSAFVQGILAGIGYYLAGVKPLFLLVALTMLLAMVPFVGATAVWAPCAVWLYVEGEVWPAVALAVYGALVVSLSDNIIKPFVLHGQSGIHPLVALLSILGGVTVLGPIGIFVGPMIVAFLQALLNILRTELESMGEADTGRRTPSKKSSRA
jgi:predicted PurR-regulated permease PerM